jgi:hypothetical protein
MCALAPAHADKRVALVIGNSAYTNIAPLRNPVKDARLIADTLSGLGFTLTGGGAQIDLDKAGFDRAVQSFGAQMSSADVALFYYAGHGIQLRGANYLVPVGANVTREADAEFQMLNVNRVLEQMDPTDGPGGRLNVVILDACRNNPFGSRLRSADRGLSVMQAPGGTLISFATQPGAAAQDGNGDHSPFTAALADSIRRPGLGLFDVFNEIGLSVKRATGGAQQPWVSSSPIAGQFYFAGLPSGKETPPPVGSAPVSDAAQAWGIIQNTTSLAVLDDFIRQFGNTPVYGSLARARREELAMQQTAAVAPPVKPAVPATVAPAKPWPGDAPQVSAPVPTPAPAVPPMTGGGGAAGQPPCMAEYVKLREDVQKKGMAAKAAGERKVPREEMCKLITSYAASEAKWVKFTEAGVQTCGIPAEVANQLKQVHANTEQTREKICTPN